jgi:hypothetical protein
MPGWRRSADRSCLYANSLQTGNFTGKIGNFGIPDRISVQQMAVLQGAFRKFPAQINRENICNNREYFHVNRQQYRPTT